MKAGRHAQRIAVAAAIVGALAAVVASPAAASDCPETVEEARRVAPEERCGWGQHPSEARIAAAAVEQEAAQKQKLADFADWQASREGNVLLGFPQGTMTVPLIKQATTYYCGPASTLMVLRYMNADGDLDSDNSDAQDELWGEVGTTPANGSDSTLIAAALNARQNDNSYNGGYYNAASLTLSGFRARWDYGFDNAAPNIPNIDTDHLGSYGGVLYEHFVVQKGYDWGDDEVQYNDPNNITHYGTYWDDAVDMYDAATDRAAA